PALAARSDPRRRRDAADLDVAREADAEVAAALARHLLLGAQAAVVDEVERAVERRFVVARVVREPAQDARVVRERVLGDEVLPPHLRGVEAELACSERDGTLDGL